MSTTRATQGRWGGPARPPESGADFFRRGDGIAAHGEPRVPRFDMADRMRKSLREADVSVQDMAEYLEVSRNTVGSWINGKTRPNAASLKLWALRVGISYEWIRNGESPQAGGPEGSQSGLPRLDLNQRPSDYLSSQVRCNVAPLRKASGTARARRVIHPHGAGAAA